LEQQHRNLAMADDFAKLGFGDHVKPRKLNTSGLSAPLPVSGCLAPELNQARLVRV
jgi:hypothetical protein